jgi:CRP-like cAMP-binding protein
LYELFHFDPKFPVLQFFEASLQYRIFRIVVFIIALYFAYRAIPENPPQRSSALKGAVFCIFTFELAVTILDIMMGQQRYNFIYGALGKLIMLLVNVYFFFLLFFLSAQLAFVIDSLEALLFLRLRKSRSKAEKKRAKQPPAMQSKAVHSLFYSVEGKLKKYYRFHQQGETIFSYGDGGNEIYYILEGEVAVFLPTMRNNDDSIAVLGSGSFIGEMSYLTSESRSATIKAKTDVSALVLPPRIFDEILKNDADLNRTIIENLSRRVRKGNEQLAALTTGK